ncbi:TylF/MycF/NovP-related O-methyltransferase [Capillibacterium thermochitinicola]|uniref:Class I SAM-dependent methyltransferase n=1 Tax=Capillibacterium thermochitinicola TaxID=2699427 RepID=A0A8J6HYE1_9FIRM|nr:TylF/MycF/NovP-related O-methyltransferase [Capillibacterium thermochitinicola]MBA2132310.1 class I SAM-dependent methyltransferase [Capillibacterium thermochitinicola]
MQDSKIKVLIFGTGEGSKKALEIIDLEKVQILAYLDNNRAKQGTVHNGVKVENPIAVDKYDYDYIVIASIYNQEITDQLLKMNVQRSKIIQLFQPKPKGVKVLVKEIYEDNMKYINILKDEYLSVYFKNYAICNMIPFDMERNKKLYNYPDYLIKGIDYVRVSTVELIAREVRERKIEGAIAELGVYKGDFSKLINDLFPDRIFYIFDTFEGFSQKDVEIEKSRNFSQAKAGHLGDTSVEIVVDKLSHKKNVVIKKGYFPQSATDLADELFSFVSIDVDLYKPTYEGLHFFYPRLSKGGYLLIHDYNNAYYSGVKEAVKQFWRETGINYIPLSDYLGSAVFIK